MQIFQDGEGGKDFPALGHIADAGADAAFRVPAGDFLRAERDEAAAGLRRPMMPRRVVVLPTPAKLNVQSRREVAWGRGDVLVP